MEEARQSALRAELIYLIRLECELDHRLRAELGGHDSHVLNGNALGVHEMRSRALRGIYDAHV